MSILAKEDRLLRISKNVHPSQFVLLPLNDRVSVVSHYLKENDPEDIGEFLKEVFPQFGDTDILILYLMSKFYFSQKSLDKIVSAINPDGNTLVKKAMKFENSTSLLIRILEFYHSNEIDWESILLEDITSETRLYIEELLLEKKMAPIPVWVSRKEGENPPLIYAESEMTLEENNEIVEDFLSALSIVDDEDEVIAEYLSENARMSVTEPEIDRYYGPQNAKIGKKCCSFDGRCRMLECKCDSGEWFNGYCDECLSSIRDISHSIRYPLKNGGWRGCYCSIECMIKKFSEKKRSFAKINNLKTFLSTVGIYDRMEK